MSAAARCSLALLAAALLPGCQPDTRTAQGYALTPPPDARPWPGPEPPVVPGTFLEGHVVPAQPAPASLIVFRSGYLPETTADQLLVQTRFLLLNLPTLEIKEEKVIDAGGRRAALVAVTAQGTGASLAPTGTGKPVSASGAPLITTRRVWLRVPREPALGTLEVTFHCPESEWERLRPAWEAVLGSLK